jgi:hypothetical protein
MQTNLFWKAKEYALRPGLEPVFAVILTGIYSLFDVFGFISSIGLPNVEMCATADDSSTHADYITCIKLR